MVAAAVLLAALVGVAIHERWFGLGTPPSASGVGSVQALVDTHLSVLGTVQVPATDQDLNVRAPLYAEFGASSAAKAFIASAAGVAPAALSVKADTSETTDSGAVQSTSYNTAPASANTRYSVTFDASNELPIITITTSAPTGTAAAHVAGAALTGLQQAAQRLEINARTTTRRSVSARLRPDEVVLRAIGPAVGATVLKQASTTKPVEYGVLVLVVLLFVILALDGLQRRRRRDLPFATS